MTDREKAILQYLLYDITAEIACWEKTIECYGKTTTKEDLLEKIKILECKVNEYKKFVENIQTLLEI